MAAGPYRLAAMVGVLGLVVGLYVGKVALGPREVAAGTSAGGDERAIRRIVMEEVRRQLDEMVRSPAAAEARVDAVANSVLSALMTVRSQLELYKLQHGDAYPAATLMADWSAFTRRSDAAGAFVDAGGFGPYLQHAVVNPVTGESAVVAPGKATARSGWTYDGKTGVFKAVVPAGSAAIKHLRAGQYEVAR